MYNECWSLTSLCKEMFNRTLNKGPVRISNWEHRPLTKKQKVYAATDAWVFPVFIDFFIKAGKTHASVAA